MDLPLPHWSSWSLRSAVVHKEDLSEPSSRVLHASVRIPLEMPVPDFVADTPRSPEPIEVSILEETPVQAVYNETHKKRPMCLPLPPWASSSNSSGTTTNFIAKTELQYPPRPSAPRRIYDTADLPTPESEASYICYSKSRHQPILSKLLETTKVSQPLSFSRSGPSKEQPVELGARLLSNDVRSTKASNCAARVRGSQHPIHEWSRLRLRSASAIATMRQTSGDRARTKLQPQSLPHSPTDSSESRVREEPPSIRASQRNTLGKARADARCTLSQPAGASTSPQEKQRSLLTAPMLPESTISTRDGNSVPNQSFFDTRRTPIATRSQHYAEVWDGPESPLSPTANFLDTGSLERVPDPRESNQSLETQASAQEHCTRRARTAATIFPSGPAHSTRITYTMAPSNNSPTQHHWVSQQTQMLSRTSFTPPFFACAQYSPRLSQSAESLHTAGQSSSSPQQLPLALPPRSSEIVHLSGQAQPTELTKVVQIKYPDTRNQTQLASFPITYSEPKVRIFLQPQKSDPSSYAYQTQQSSRIMNVVPHVNVNLQHRTQVQYASPPTQYTLGSQQSPLSLQLCPPASSRISDQISSAQIFLNQPLNIPQPTVLSSQIDFLN